MNQSLAPVPFYKNGIFPFCVFVMYCFKRKRYDLASFRSSAFSLIRQILKSDATFVLTCIFSLLRITAPTFNLLRFTKPWRSFKLSPGYIFGIEIFRTPFEMSPRPIKKKYITIIPCYCLIVQIKWVVFARLIVNMTLINFAFFVRVWKIPQLSSIISFQDVKLSIGLHCELAPKFGFSFIMFYAW